MKISFISMVDDKKDYLTVLEAVTGEKNSFSAAEKERLLAIYADNAKSKFGFEDEVLLKAVLAMDVPGASLLDQVDADALDALKALCADREPGLKEAVTIKAIALSGDVSVPLALAMARAALDILANQDDIASCRDDIIDLAEYLKQADESTFADASAFLVRVRERVR